MGSNEPPESLAASYPGFEQERFESIADETPVHEVHITRPFYLGQYEVTVGQFRRFLEESGHIAESIADGTGGYGFDPAHDPLGSGRREYFSGRSPIYSWSNPGFEQNDQHPVVNVTWNDANAMAAWLSRKEGQIYRLPTEAEWEYAGRAGTRTRYHGGDDPLSLLQTANTFDRDAARHWPQWLDDATPGHDGYAFTAPVGQFNPNLWGLYDMHGNVWEWVSDWYGADYYRQSPVTDPQGPPGGEVRVRRGGSWHTWSFYARMSFRNWNSPDTRYTLVGIRLVRDLSEHRDSAAPSAAP